MPFGEELRRLRQAASLSQEELAERAGLSRRALTALERGERTRPYPHTVRVLAQALGLDERQAASLIRSTRPGGHGRALETGPFGSPLIGRDDDVDRINRLLAEDGMRLLTIVGPGGVGKTRLAQAVLEQAAGEAVLVPLAAVADPGLVLNTAADALGVREGEGLGLDAALVSALESRQLLLAFDNFEHVLEAAANVASLLRRCPHLKLLVTSRQPLRVDGEREYHLEPLPLPDAVKLFQQRASQVGVEVAETDTLAMEAICARIDGLPLAVELAASWMRAMPALGLLGRLDRALTLLIGGRADSPKRHRALRETIVWSYDLLDSAEQTLFRRLGVFAGGFTVEAVSAVCADGDEAATLVRLAGLVEKNLVRPADDDLRFHLLYVVREFARERMTEAGEGWVEERHAEWFRSLTREFGDGFRSAAMLGLLNRIDAERDNLRIALSWYESSNPAAGLAMAADLGWAWYLTGRLSEGRITLERLLSMSAGDTSSVELGRARLAMGVLAWGQGDDRNARPHLDEAVRVLGPAGDLKSVAFALIPLGHVLIGLGEMRAAVSTLEDAVALAVSIGDEYELAHSRNTLGQARLLGGEVEAAIALSRQALAWAEGAGDDWLAGICLGALGGALSVAGRCEEAIEALRRSIDLYRGRPGQMPMVRSLLRLGRAALLADDPALARDTFQECLRLARTVGHQPGFALSLAGLAAVALHLGDPRTAVMLFAAAGTPTEKLASMAIGFAASSAGFVETPGQARDLLSRPDFEDAWARGKGMSREDVVTLALGGA